MILKIVTLFLVGIAVMGMFGKLRMPSLRNLKPKMMSRGKCKSCGAPLVGRAPCPCGSSGKRGGARGT